MDYKIIKGPVYKSPHVEDEGYVASYSTGDINGSKLRFDIWIAEYTEEQTVVVCFGNHRGDYQDVGSVYEVMSPTDSPEVAVIAEILSKRGEVRWRKWEDKGA